MPIPVISLIQQIVVVNPINPGRNHEYPDRRSRTQDEARVDESCIHVQPEYEHGEPRTPNPELRTMDYESAKRRMGERATDVYRESTVK